MNPRSYCYERACAPYRERHRNRPAILREPMFNVILRGSPAVYRAFLILTRSSARAPFHGFFSRREETPAGNLFRARSSPVTNRLSMEDYKKNAPLFEPLKVRSHSSGDSSRRRNARKKPATRASARVDPEFRGFAPGSLEDKNRPSRDLFREPRDEASS